MAAGQTGVIWNDVVLGVTAIITAIVALGYERMTASAGANYSNRT
ncbi:MAG TPA: hypothetical protein VFN49_05090 [Candidatus Aquilonibacter sp.]|nr:hypothetical protein [Candidatus Aquilonibacter sp.]